MRKFIVPIVMAACIFSFLAGAELNLSAEDVGGDIIFKDTKKLKPVLFSHEAHKKAGINCDGCHDKIFKKQKGSTDKDNALTMKSMKKGSYCGTCHNGKEAFTVKRKCGKCHLKAG